MSNRLLFSVLVAGGALALAGWLVLAFGSGGRRSSTGASPLAASAADDTRPPERMAPARAPDPEPPGGQTVAEPAALPVAAGAKRVSLHEEELAQAHWISGRVVFPPGTPDDERVTVTADGHAFEHGPRHGCTVAADGAFRVAFAAGTRKGRLLLEARYLYLEKGVRIDVRAEQDALLLEPELGGWIDGAIVLGPGVSAESLAGASVVLQTVDRIASGTGSNAQPSGLAFEFTGLRPTLEHRLELESKLLWAPPLAIEGVEPGRRTPVTLEVRCGVSIEGRVVDEHGIPRAEVSVNSVSNHLGRPSIRHARTGLDGTFRLQGLPPGSITLQPRADGGGELIRVFPVAGPGERELLAVRDGEVLTGIELVLGHGLGISGRVRWPDGSPAQARIEVHAEGHEGPRLSLQMTIPAQEDGRFEAVGLGAGRYRIEAQATHTAEVPETDARTGKVRTKKKRSAWRAVAREVAAGSTNIELTLDPGFTLLGTVRDDLGALVDDFRIEAGQDEDPSPWNTPRATLSSVPSANLWKSFHDARGAFELSGFQLGPWSVVAEAKGHGHSKPVRIVISQEQQATVELVVPRAARVEGFVVDASGRGVAAAGVTVVREGDPIWHRGPVVRADEDGRFVLEDVPPGSIGLLASSDGAAPSEQRAFTLQPGELVTDVEICLRRGGRITGEVVDAAGRGLAGRDVQIWGRMGPGAPDRTRSDESGRFVLEHLPPGTYQLRSEPTPEEMALVGGDLPGTQDLLQREARVELGLEATQHVVLAPPSIRPVRLHGRITLGKAPLASAHVSAWSSGENGRGSGAETDGEGRYSLVLAGAGPHSVQVWDRSTGLRDQSQVDVPAVESFAFDLAIAAGTISGQVRGPGGTPLGNVEVLAEPEGTGHEGSGGTTTDARGAYELTVPAGTYTVTAGGSSRRPTGSPWCPARILGVQVGSGGEVRGIDFDLQGGGTIEGTVRGADASTFVGRAWVQVFDERDESIAMQATDATGAFRIHGVRPGTVRVAAASEGLVCRSRVTLEVAADRIARAELELVPGTRVSARILDRRGEPVAAEKVELVRADGETRLGTIRDEGLVWLGGHPPGACTVRAFHDGAVVERELVLTGEPETTVELRFE